MNTVHCYSGFFRDGEEMGKVTWRIFTRCGLLAPEYLGRSLP